MKFWKLSLAILIGIGMVIGLFGYFTPITVVEAEPEAQYVRPHVPFLSHSYQEVAADDWSILVDLSDTTSFPHFRTNRIILKALKFDGDLDMAMKWRIRVGVVTATDATSTEVEWIHTVMRVRAAQFSTVWTLPEHGLNLMVTNEDLPFVVTDQISVTAVITSSTTMSSTGHISTTVGVGDLILFTDEVSDTATLDIGVSAAYDTE